MSERMDVVMKEEDFEDQKIDKAVLDEYARNLPEGWTYREIVAGGGSILKHFISPGGRNYQSRIDAIRALQETKHYQDKVVAEKLRVGLVDDGWMEHPLLPRGWFARDLMKDDPSMSVRMKFLTPDNQIIMGKKRAFKYFEKFEYGSEALDSLKQFVDSITHMKREADDGWIDGDDTLPPGWKYKTYEKQTGTLYRLLTPSGDTFASRHKAYLHMIEGNFKKADVSRMRESLCLEGWIKTEYLPPKWLYRRSKSGRNEVTFLSPKGEMFLSRRILIDFMSSHPEKYNNDDLENINILSEKIKAEWVSNKQDWKTDDPSVPSGWSIRYFHHERWGNSINVMSPCGSVFFSRTKALKFMAEAKEYNEKDMDDMREMLTHEGWVVHPLLPDKWRLNNGGPEGDDVVGIKMFLSPDGSTLSLQKAIIQMKNHSELYDQTDIENIRSIVKGLRKDDGLWKPDPTVPEGWLYKKVPHQKYFREYFKQPNGEQLTGRINTIQTLMKQGYDISGKDIETLKSGLHIAGWCHEEMLPPGWIKKEIQKSPGTFKYVSPDFKEFHNLRVVYIHLKANKCPSDVLMKLKRMLNVKNDLSIMRNQQKSKFKYHWETVDYLPTDWKAAKVETKYTGKTKFLTPSGVMLNHAVLVYQVLVSEKVHSDFLNGHILQMMEEEGWQSDQYLPSDWMLNVNKEMFPKSVLPQDEEADVLFLTDKAQILTKDQAKLLFSEKNNYTDSDKAHFLYLLTSLQEQLERKTWRQDESLPVGWMMKQLDYGYRKELQIMSSDGKIFENYLSAYLHMLSEDKRDEIVDTSKVLEKLADEGFVEDSLLPKGWLIARNSRGQLFEILSAEGVLFQTLDDAQEFLEMSETYGPRDSLLLEDLCMEEIEKYVKRKELGVVKSENSEQKIKITKAKKRKHSA